MKYRFAVYVGGCRGREGGVCVCSVRPVSKGKQLPVSK